MGWTVYDLNGNIKTNALGNPVPVTNGGTGTSTQFTQGSIVFAGTNGVYSQDNANLFYLSPHQVGIGTNAPNVFGGNTTAAYLTLQGDGSNVGAGGRFELVNPKNPVASGDEAGRWGYFLPHNSGAENRITQIVAFASGSGGANGFGGDLTFYTKADNGTLTAVVTFDNTGAVKIIDGSGGAAALHFTSDAAGHGTGIYKPTTDYLGLAAGGTGAAVCAVDGGVISFRIRSDSLFEFSSTTSLTAASDIAFARNAPGVVEVNSGTAGTFKDILARALRSNPVTFANLPASPLEGMLVAVTDSNTAVWGAAIAGGGANHVLAYYDGTAWTVAAK